ncbi:DUF2235 domain-containing protein [Mycena kentingensis (nom. inval.)]|nr:DUF2235 domain-containing protein [Mycena kentingensis (nom. inval.)]
MLLWQYGALRLVHLVYTFVSLIAELWSKLRAPPPLPLRATRRRLPQHLGILFVHASNSQLARECLQECIQRAVGWSRAVGVEKLTLYDDAGLLEECADDISERLYASCGSPDESVESEVEYPLTPPLSDCSDSRPLSPEASMPPSATTIQLPPSIRKRNSRFGLKTRRSREQISQRPVTLCIASRRSGKPAIAAAATTLAQKRAFGAPDTTLSVQTLDGLLEGPNSVSAPDFMIVHHLNSTPQPLELYGFPPWQIRLTEIHYKPRSGLIARLGGLLRTRPKNAPNVLSEEDFRAALDDFAGAEMRFGR